MHFDIESAHNKVDCITINGITNHFASSNGKKISFYYTEERQSDVNYSNEKAVEFANYFISENAEKLTIAGDEEIEFYASISNTHEIPKIYVKFGFEKAIYRLDSRGPIEEKITESTKLEVNNWFDLNQESQLYK